MVFTTQDLKTLFGDLAALMTRERDSLCALDGVIGDADHGIAMEQGMIAASAADNEMADNATLRDVLNASAKGFLNAIGASSGPLYATAFLRVGKILGSLRTYWNLRIDDHDDLVERQAAGLQPEAACPILRPSLLDWTRTAMVRSPRMRVICGATLRRRMPMVTAKSPSMS